MNVLTPLATARVATQAASPARSVNRLGAWRSRQRSISARHQSILSESLDRPGAFRPDDGCPRSLGDEAVVGFHILGSPYRAV
jgi:hypothetical protein